MNTNISTYKEKLLDEKKAIEGQLQSIGVKNPQNPSAWQPSQNDVNDDEPADRTETADAITNFESDQAIVSSFDTRLLEINDALARIENDTFGVCKVCGKEIESDRLNANAAATTCKAHIEA